MDYFYGVETTSLLQWLMDKLRDTTIFITHGSVYEVNKIRQSQ